MARVGLRCPRCGETFAFSPKTSRLTDQRFENALYAVSEGGTIQWTLDHLYYEVSRRSRLPRLSSRRDPFVRLDRAEFDAMCEQWRRAHRNLASIQTQPGMGWRPAETMGPYTGGIEADVATYTFDRAVVCDRWSTVDLLLANNFHIEARCAVLSIDGYPADAFATVLDMLRRSPTIDVLAVHDASPNGCDLPAQLTSSEQWFRPGILAGRVRLVDAGLRPGQVGKLKGCYLHNQQPFPSGVFPPDDAEWLRRYNLELAAVRPGRVLRYLHRMITGAGAAGTERDPWVWGATGDWDDGGGDDGFG